MEEQIQELLRLGIIKPSKSEMGSPIVCVLKGKDGKDGIRIAIDYRYLNKYCEGDAHPMPDIPDLMLRVWKSRYKSLNKIPWGSKENQAFQTLKDKLCEATPQPMSIADFGKPWILQVLGLSIATIWCYFSV